MASLRDLELVHRVFMQRYRYSRYHDGAARPATLRRPLEAAVVALVTTGGLHRSDQTPFDPSVPGGDPSYRVLEREVDASRLVCSHKSDAFDHGGIAADPEVAFPISALRALARDGHVGGVAPIHLSFMGSITRPERLIATTAPEAARRLAALDVDAALLVPV